MRKIVLAIYIGLNISGLAQQKELNYAKLKPIIEKKCVSCHRENGYAPFGLENYNEIVKRKDFIKYVITNDYMPPWRANNNYRHFANSKALSKEEKSLILQWLNEGARIGPEKPTSNKKWYNEGSQVNQKPDLILSMKAPFTVPAINQNVYICYKIPFELKHDTFIKAIEFVPGNKSVVHHASYQIIEVADDVDVFSGPDFFQYDADTLNRVKDDHDYKYFNLIGKNGKMPKEVYHNGWLPGTSVQTYPSGIGFKMPKKGVLLIRNFHYSPTPIEQQDLSKFYIFFSSKPAIRNIGFAAFKPNNPTKDGKWYIKANDSNFAAHINVKFHNDVSLLNINPHMHKLGKYFKAYAVTSKNDTIPLVEIPKWDFNWQEFYRFEKMIKIPAGSVLHAEALYDNSAKNAANPYSPPKDVLFEWGMNDDSEMMRLVLLFLPYEMGDEKIALP